MLLASGRLLAGRPGQPAQPQESLGSWRQSKGRPAKKMPAVRGPALRPGAPTHLGQSRSLLAPGIVVFLTTLTLR